MNCEIPPCTSDINCNFLFCRSEKINKLILPKQTKATQSSIKSSTSNYYVSNKKKLILLSFANFIL